MSKAKQTPVEQKLITLTKEQFEKLLEIHSTLDGISDVLNDIDGDDGSLFEIGKAIGVAYSDTIDAYNELSEILAEKQEEMFENEDEDEN